MGLMELLVIVLVVYGIPLNFLLVGFILLRYKHSKESAVAPKKPNTELEKIQEINNSGNEEQNSEFVDILNEYLNGKER